MLKIKNRLPFKEDGFSNAIKFNLNYLTAILKEVTFSPITTLAK